ncbi:TetR/AcrR family transcriptional regulator [Glycomyces sp. NPDC049804]|uniref:TetR/AcrR family transcriptional regulator n=1 Tax=Glycomyces sp. NPDC049804 TaxID=3154363 RepID=UPI003449DF98
MSSTSERIAAAAKDLVTAGGSASVSMRKIGDALGLSPMAVYRHFPNREALLARVADDLFDDAYDRLSRKAIPADTVAALHGAVDDLVDLALDHPRQFAFMFIEPRDGARTFPADFSGGRSRLFGLLTGIVDAGIANGTLAPTDSWKVGLTLTANVYGLVALHQGGRIALSDEDFRELCHDSLERLLNGILA